jgi:hypothetical protein
LSATFLQVLPIEVFFANKEEGYATEKIEIKYEKTQKYLKMYKCRETLKVTKQL